MIKKYDQYNESLNEGKKFKHFIEGLIYAILFSGNISTDNRIVSYSYNDIEKFSIENNSNSNIIIQKSLNIVKNKVLNDINITNKKEILNKLDSILFVYNDHSDIPNYLYNASNSNNENGAKTICFAINSKLLNYPIIFLSEDAPSNKIIHEILHVVGVNINLDDINKIFDFNLTFDEYFYKYIIMINEEKIDKYIKYIQCPFDKDDNLIKYYTDKDELYVRLNNLKLYLYNINILKDPNDNITKEIIYKLKSGEIFKNLSETEKFEFIKSDFIILIPFIKNYKDINLYASINNSNNKLLI
jgi:hypothetical protein